MTHKSAKQPTLLQKVLHWFNPDGLMQTALIEAAIDDNPSLETLLRPVAPGDFRPHPDFAGCSYAGRHVIFELWGCTRGIDSASQCEAILRTAATAMGATVLGSRFVQFAPQGVTGALILSESHIAIHTWPEHGYAAVDIFTCGDCDPMRALPTLERRFLSGEVKTRLFHRGEVEDGNLMQETVDASLHFRVTPEK